MTYNSQDLQDEVFSFSLTNDTPALLHSPSSLGSTDAADMTHDDDFLIESPGFGAMATEDDELFALDNELSMLPRSYDGKATSLEAVALFPNQDEFANAAQDNYRLWLAGV